MEKYCGPFAVSAVRVPATVPVCVGVNLSGTWIVWPAESVAGSGGEGGPDGSAHPRVSRYPTSRSISSRVRVSVTHTSQQSASSG